ncbi:ABC transporter substrate-binding protein [Tessaracoccus coleopterorum]|uniref:ABC transporter substrate-binding protein n=1 Tax=Tessaracoccus coleopterorum TaxID=2714950 RepID=UPI001E5BE2E1|nr:extracellular solute-binding protein [Tessaracoccus coleopterorum]
MPTPAGTRVRPSVADGHRSACVDLISVFEARWTKFEHNPPIHGRIKPPESSRRTTHVISSVYPPQLRARRGRRGRRRRPVRLRARRERPYPGRNQQPDRPAASQDPGALGDITLVVWDQEVRGSQNDALEALNKAFQEKYPNIKIERKSQSFDDLKAQVSLALSGNDVPDVVQVNNARADMGQFVKAGQLADLSAYATQFGWEDRFPTSVLSKVRYSADGKTFGEGNLYGLPQTGEVVGIYYSQKKLDALGIKVPTTWDEYFSQLDAALAKGEQPMILGNIDKWPALHVFGPSRPTTSTRRTSSSWAWATRGLLAE